MPAKKWSSCYCGHVMDTWTYQSRGLLMPRITHGVRVLLIITAAVFGVQIICWWLVGDAFDVIFGLNRLAARGWIWQPVTYMFLHGRWVLHILLNMLVLYFLGPEIEHAMGTWRFMTLYLLCGMVGGLMWLLTNSQGVCMGASGAVFGLAVAYGMLFPDRRITLLLFFVLPVTITGRMMAIGAGVMAVLPILTRESSGIAHVAHLGGAFAGYLYVRAAKGSGSYFEGRYSGARSLSWLGSMLSRLRRRKIRILSRDSEVPPSQAEVDRVLDKLAQNGWEGLSSRDRDILDRASKNK